MLNMRLVLDDEQIQIVEAIAILLIICSLFIHLQDRSPPTQLRRVWKTVIKFLRMLVDSHWNMQCFPVSILHTQTTH